MARESHCGSGMNTNQNNQAPETATVRYYVGSECHWCPAGYRAWQDTSWDKSGTGLLCRASDAVILERGGPDSFTVVELPEGAQCLRGRDAVLAFAKAQGVGSNDGLGMGDKQASESACEAALTERAARGPFYMG
jgi:hypothetical protein